MKTIYETSVKDKEKSLIELHTKGNISYIDFIDLLYKNVSIKDWYLEQHPTDSEALQFNENITFFDLYFYMFYQEGCIYELLQAGDSITREIIFIELASLFKVDYDHIYYLWLGGNEMVKEKGL